MNLKFFFLEHCKNNKFEINQNQLDIIYNLERYYSDNFKQNLLSKIFKRNKMKLGFYLVGDVGVGKTMILNFFFNIFNKKKLRLHFNEFMIKFHISFLIIKIKKMQWICLSKILRKTLN